MNSVNENSNLKKIEVMSPKQVREALNIDNDEIIRLCKIACLIPKKDKNGNTYFSRRDFHILKNANELYKKTRNIEEQITSSGKALPALRGSGSVITNKINEILNNISTLENNVVERMTKVIDEKMDGMDEVVVELIRCKTENESLRAKLNDANKENYKLKNEIGCFKGVGFGFYYKKDNDEIIL